MNSGDLGQVGSVLRLSRVVSDDHDSSRSEVKERWIKHDLQTLYGDALAFFAQPPRLLPVVAPPTAPTAAAQPVRPLPGPVYSVGVCF